MTCLSLSNSWVNHSIPLFTLSSPFLVHLCAITFRMSYSTFEQTDWSEDYPAMIDAQEGTQLASLLTLRYGVEYYLPSKINPITGLDRPTGFQEVDVTRLQDNRDMNVVRLSALRTCR
jgi:hypothetical protein